MASDERDLQFERALAKHLRNESDAACPDAEILAAYHERTLSSEEMTYWKSHIASCARCQEALSLLEQTEKVLGERNSGKVDPSLVEQLTAATSFRAASAVAREQVLETQPAQAMSGAGSQSAKVIELQRRKTARRWMLPLGTLAAALLLFAGVYEMRLTNREKMASTEMAANRPAPPQEQERADYSSRVELGAPSQANPPIGSKTAPTPIYPKTPMPSRTSNEPAVLDRTNDSRELPKEADQEEKQARQALGEAKTRASISNSMDSGAGGNLAIGSGADQNVAPRNQVARTPVASAARTAAVGGAAAKTQAAGVAKPAEKKDVPASVSETVQVEAAAPVVTNSSDVAVSSDSLSTRTESPINSRDVSQLAAIAKQSAAVIAAPDSKHAWRLGAGGAIELTTNAGKSWKLQKSGVRDDLTAGSAASDKVCWLAGKAGTLLLTTDGGKHWKKVSTPIQGDIGGVHAIDAQHAAIWDVPNRLNFETADGGATWKRAGNE